MYVLLITRLLRGVGRWARKPVNHTSWVAVVTPTDRPKSVRNCCLIELFCGVVSVAIEHCNGCGLPTEDAYSSGHLVLSHLGLAFVLLLRPFFPELVMSTDLMSFEHPSVLLFCFASLTFLLV